MLSSDQRIRDFLLSHIRNSNLADDEDIFEAGYVNSLFALKLVMFVEKEFQMIVDDEDLKMDNFRSVTAIKQLVEKKSNP